MAITLISSDDNQLVDSLVSLTPAKPTPIVEGDTDIAFDVWRPATDSTFASATNKLAIGLADDGSGSNGPQGGTFYIRYESPLTSGSLVQGKRYLIVSYETGDDFANVGGENSSGSVFIAAGTTPTTWTNGSVLKLISADLDYDATVEEFQTALRAMSSDTAFASATVVGEDGGPYTIIGGDYTDLEDFALSTDGLVPQCEYQRATQQNGDDVGQRFIQRLALIQMPCALATTSSAIPAGAASVNKDIAGVTNTTPAVWTLEIDGMPYAGVLQIDVDGETASVAFNAPASTLQSSLEALSTVGFGNVAVEQIESGPEIFKWQITFDASLGDVTVTVDDAAITFAIGRRFLVDLDTLNMWAALSGKDTADFRIELQSVTGDVTRTLFRSAISVENDLIHNLTGPPLSPETPLVPSVADMRYVRNLTTITGLTGGGSSNLDGMVTVNETVGQIFCVVVSNVAYLYRLEAGTTFESSPTIILPDDYDASTNAKFYRLLSTKLYNPNFRGAPTFDFGAKDAFVMALTLHTTASQYTVSSSGTTTITPAAYDRFLEHKISALAGSGSYTRNFVLAAPAGGQVCTVTLLISFDASVNPTISIRNLTAGGTELASFAASELGGSAGSAWATLRTRDGSNWELVAAGWNS